MSRLHLWRPGVQGQGASRSGSGEDRLLGGVFSLCAHMEQRVKSLRAVSFIRPHLWGGGHSHDLNPSRRPCLLIPLYLGIGISAYEFCGDRNIHSTAGLAVTALASAAT